jgi:hypothetical protein
MTMSSTHFLSAEACGAEVFKSAVLMKLATQQRSLSSKHNANIDSMRCTDPKARPITMSLLMNTNFCLQKISKMTRTSERLQSLLEPTHAVTRSF